MIAVHMADFDSQFIAAQGSARSDDMFRVQRPICSGQELRPITRQKFAMFTIIEREWCCPRMALCSPQSEHRGVRSSDSEHMLIHHWASVVDAVELTVMIQCLSDDTQ